MLRVERWLRNKSVQDVAEANEHSSSAQVSPNFGAIPCCLCKFGSGVWKVLRSSNLPLNFAVKDRPTDFQLTMLRRVDRAKRCVRLNMAAGRGSKRVTRAWLSEPYTPFSLF